jgi:alpha-L-rhamnosidase
MLSVSADQATNGDVGNTSPAYNFSTPGGGSSIVWGGAMVQTPWQLYLQYDDLRVARDTYAAMKRYIDGAKGSVSANYPFLTSYNGLSDHIGLEGNTSGGNGSMLLQNVLWTYLTGALAEMAEAIGETEDAAKWRDRYAIMIDSWNRCWVEPATGMTVSRSAVNGNLSNITLNNITNHYLDTQSTYAYALQMNIVSDTMTITDGPDAGMTYRDFFARRLAELIADPMKTGNGRGPSPNSAFVLASGGNYTSSGKPYTITTGFAATPTLLPALSATGSHEAAYRLVSNTDYAAWLYPVQYFDATTQWELWDSYDRAMMWAGQSGMNSFNHFALGAAASWIYEYQMGITTGDTRGYQDFVLQPSAGGNYTSLNGSYISNYGTIESAWTAMGNGSADAKGVAVTSNKMTSYCTVIPANTTATLYLPVGSSDAKVSNNLYGAYFAGLTTHNGVRVAEFKLLAGGYVFNISSDDVISVAYAEGYVAGALPKLTVTFDTDGGSEVEAAVVVYGDKVQRPEDPARYGFTFMGWTLNGPVFDFDGAIFRDITLKAVWELVPITSLKIDAIAIVTVKRGDVRHFNAITNEDATTEYLEWKTANPALAEVSADGVVTVKNVIGTVVLTVTDPATGRSHSVLLRIAS